MISNHTKIKNATNSKGSTANSFTINEYQLNDSTGRLTNYVYKCLLKGANKHEHT